MYLMRKRAALLALVQQTNSPSHWPELGKHIASKAHRAGVAERFPAPAVPKSIAVAWALSDYDDCLRSDRELSSGQTARQQDANTLYRLQPVPGVGKIFRLGLLYDIHAIQRFPRGQAFVSSGRLGTCATASARTRSGPAGTKSGHASLTWAFAAAAVLLLRNQAQGQQRLAR